MSSQQLDEEAIFDVARRIADHTARSDYLDQVCAGDQALRERVEALLQVHEQEQEFLKSNPEPAQTVDQPAPTEAVGQQIGRYKLLQQIGEGGFGVVYMAEQHRPVRRKVALKVIKPGMDTGAVVARFEAERQALAMMDHPNISRVLDGGATESGRPYFVMDLVRGVAITEYCDKNQLSTKDRLELFMTVCQAVQHAHQKGVIHRDIKPSNILVTLHDGQPVVKVIDFGVAKAINQQLTEKTLFTAYGQMVGTPQYMSPEQAEMSGLDVDTRSDIYSLGVLLYELLTGETPLDAERLRTAGYAEMQRIIQEEEPPKPSRRLSTAGEQLTIIAKHRSETPERLPRLLRGDLDWIAMKALEKDRNRRYDTAAALSADITDHLNDQPVSAFPPSPVYRLRKFAKKHRTALATTIAMGVLVVIAIIGLSHLTIKLAGERDRADREALRAADEAAAASELVLQLRNTLFDQGLSNILSGEHELAESKIQELRQAGAEQLANKLNALLILQLGQTDEIGGVLDFVLDEIEKQPESIAYQSLLAMAYRRKGDSRRRSDARRILAGLTPETYEDYIFAALAEVNPIAGDRIELINDALKFGRSPILLLLLGVERSRLASVRGNVDLVDKAMEEVKAAKVQLGMRNSHVRSWCLRAALWNANTRRLNGLDWEGPLEDVKDVILAAERAQSPTFMERFYLGVYYANRGEFEKALFQFKQADIETASDFCAGFYLALAAERNVQADPKLIGDLKQRSEQRLNQMALAWYLAMQGRVREALELCDDPQTEFEKSNEVSLLYATGAISSAKARAAEVLESLGDEKPTAHRRYLAAVAEDWDDVRLLEAAESFFDKGSHYGTEWGHYWLGIRYLGRGDLLKARTHFQRCVDQYDTQSAPHIWARAFAHRLPDMTSWPPVTVE